MEISIVPLVVILQPILLGSSHIFGGIQHLHTLVHRLDAIVALVGDLESLARTLLGGHLDDTRCTTRTIERGLGSILQHRETLDVGRIDGGKGSHIGGDAIDDDQWVVATHDGGGTTHSHTVEHGDAVETIGRHVDTCRLAIQGIQGVVDHTFLQQFRFHDAHRPGET